MNIMTPCRNVQKDDVAFEFHQTFCSARSTDNCAVTFANSKSRRGTPIRGRPTTWQGHADITMIHEGRIRVLHCPLALEVAAYGRMVPAQECAPYSLFPPHGNASAAMRHEAIYRSRYRSLSTLCLHRQDTPAVLLVLREQMLRRG